MRFIQLFSFIFLFSFNGYAQQLEFNFGDANSILENTFFLSDNIRLSYDIPEGITKMWDERDFAFEIADGYYGYGPSAQYEILDEQNNVIGYMLAQTLIYSESDEYHVAYTVASVEGSTLVELEYEVYSPEEAQKVLPPELIPSGDE